MRYPYLSRPGNIGRLRLRCRVMLGSMHMGFEGPGADRERLARFYVERARGGAALIITGGAAVSPEGGGDHYGCLTDASQHPIYAHVAAAVRDAGSLSALQLFHTGRYTRKSETGRDPISPSGLKAPIFPDVPHAPTTEEIWAVVEAFGRGARLARELGFDAVEIMGSEGYLINQFLSPYTNRREDDWGGDLRGRMRFGLEVLRAARAEVGPDYPILFRMSGIDLVPDSTPFEETAEFARQLVSGGVDALNMGIGWHESSIPTIGMMVPRAAFAFVPRRVRDAIGAAVPVIASNRINTPEAVEQVLATESADFVALARPLLADPQFVAKARADEAHRINTCIACNQACLDNILDLPLRAASCMVNPAAGREAEFELRPSLRPGRVAVVGSGPAGLESARVLAERGHRVTLFEREPEIGGQLRLAVRVPGKSEFGETIRYFRTELERLRVDIRVGTEPTVEGLATGFDAVVCATGVRPFVPSPQELPGVELPHVIAYPEVFLRRRAIGDRVAIIGGGGIACDLAHFLTEEAPASPEAVAYLEDWGILDPEEALRHARGRRQVAIMRRGGRIGTSIGRTTRWAVLAALRRRGVQMLTGISYRAIETEGVRIVRDGREELIPADTVVLACGQRPLVDLAGALAGRLPCHVIGGAREARELNAVRAFHEAAVLGREI